ncbi:hypothetical protein [Pseudovibrio sp. SPO723]|uniref:hypothetical protein n=1 Tax=Nesiotobacter zosterae TaxID=392721 RepID=UPI0029C4B95F|nr:hypothetical protein [Pseudovibrio sp. SPO723]MDX5595629.1 hypothetical protein [Pseudovibrio sp. SPO723]
MLGRYPGIRNAVFLLSEAAKLAFLMLLAGAGLWFTPALDAALIAARNGPL